MLLTRTVNCYHHSRDSLRCNILKTTARFAPPNARILSTISPRNTPYIQLGFLVAASQRGRFGRRRSTLSLAIEAVARLQCTNDGKNVYERSQRIEVLKSIPIPDTGVEEIKEAG